MEPAVKAGSDSGGTMAVGQGDRGEQGIWVPGDSLDALVVTSARAIASKPGTLDPVASLALSPSYRRFIMSGKIKVEAFVLGCAIVFWVGSGAILPAQSPPATAGDASKLTLVEARRIAFEKNWDLLAAKSGVDMAVAQQIVARQFPNPTVSVSTAKINTDGNPSSTPAGNTFWHRNYDTIFSVNQLVEIGGKRSSRRNSSQAGATGARARFFDAKRLLDQGVTKAYVAALLAEDNVKILQQSALSLRREADIAATRFKAGDISDSDKKRIEINAQRFELSAQTAEVAAVSARVAVEVLMGVERPKGAWRSDETLEQLADSGAHGVEAKTGAARPDLLAAEADLKKASADLALQKALRVPDPTFLMQYEHEPPDQPNTVGVGVSFPLPLWNLNKGAIKSAEAAREQSALQVQKIQTQILTDIIVAERTYQDAAERRERYQKQISPKSGEVQKAVDFAYEKGGASLVDLLDAERDDNDVRLAAAQALADSANAAADLASARSVLSESELTSRK